jgi:hypothetical protein
MVNTQIPVENISLTPNSLMWSAMLEQLLDGRSISIPQAAGPNSGLAHQSYSFRPVRRSFRSDSDQGNVG